MKKTLLIIAMLIPLMGCQISQVSQFTDGIVQTAIANTQAAYTATPTLMPLESWRIPPLDNSEVYTDVTSNDQMNEYAQNKAEDLNVKPPYRWDVCDLPEGKSFKDVSFHYTNALRDKGYATEFIDYNPERKAGWNYFSTPERNIYILVLEEYRLVYVFYKDVIN